MLILQVFLVNAFIRPLQFRLRTSPRIKLSPSVIGGSNGGFLPPTSLFGSFEDENDNNTMTNDNSKKKSSILNQWMELSESSREDIKQTIFSFAFALVIRLLVFEPRYIPSLSMFPTFDIGDQLLVDKITKIVKPFDRRDVVVFNPSQTYVDLTGNTEALIKRIVAIAGDTVEIKDSTLYVNGEPQVEPFINEKPDYILPPLVVPSGTVLVLGDNRNHSYDSHIWGFLPTENIVGRAVVKYWPPWRVGFIEGSH